MRFLLALPVVTLSTPIKLPRLHHKCDECLDERNFVMLSITIWSVTSCDHRYLFIHDIEICKINKRFQHKTYISNSFYKVFIWPKLNVRKKNCNRERDNSELINRKHRKPQNYLLTREPYWNVLSTQEYRLAQQRIEIKKWIMWRRRNVGKPE